MQELAISVLSFALYMFDCQKNHWILSNLLDYVWPGMSLSFNFITLILLFLGAELTTDFHPQQICTFIKQIIP